MQVTITGEAVDEPGYGLTGSERLEHRRGVDDEHQDSVAVASGPHGGHDCSALGTA
jgi:hypothetical protein